MKTLFIIATAAALTSCGVTFDPDTGKPNGAYVDAKGALVLGNAAYDSWRSHHPGKGHQPIEPAK